MTHTNVLSEPLGFGSSPPPRPDGWLQTDFHRSLQQPTYSVLPPPPSPPPAPHPHPRSQLQLRCTDLGQLPPESSADACQLSSRCLPGSPGRAIPCPGRCTSAQLSGSSGPIDILVLWLCCCARPLTLRGLPQCSLHLAGEEGGALHQAMRIQAVTPEVGARPEYHLLGYMHSGRGGGGGGGVCSPGLPNPPNRTHLRRSCQLHWPRSGWMCSRQGTVPHRGCPSSSSCWKGQ